MRKRNQAIAGALLVGLTVAAGVEIRVRRLARSTPLESHLGPKVGDLPLYFIENRGQLHPRVNYYLAGSDKKLYFSSRGVLIAMRQRQAKLLRASQPAEPENPTRWNVFLEFLGARSGVEVTGEETTGATVSYFLGPVDQHKTNIPAYAGIRYRGLWDGIDLAYRGTVNRLKYEFVVAAGADPGRIRMAYRGAATELLDDGRLAVKTPAGSFEDDRPVAYQDADGVRREVRAAFHRNADGSWGFAVGDYDRRQALVIDPSVLIYSGFLGGGDQDFGNDIAVDAGGSAYIAGTTYSLESSFGAFPPTVGPDTTHNGSSDAFVAKLNPAATQLVYLGFIGGSLTDQADGIAIDPLGNAYVAGSTTSPNFPTTPSGNPLVKKTARDAFVVKVNPSGSQLVFASLLAGAKSDQALGIALDSQGAAYVAGYTDSPDFPVAAGPNPTFAGAGVYSDGFIAKLSPAGTAIVYAGFLGGTGYDQARAVAVGPDGAAYVTGLTSSSPFAPPLSGFDSSYGGGSSDAFVVKLDPNGAPAWGTYIGGSAADWGDGMGLDPQGNVYLAGTSASPAMGFPVSAGFPHQGGLDAFVVKLNPQGSAALYSAYLGGPGSDSGLALAVDASGRAHLTGYTMDFSFPAVENAFGGGFFDAFVAVLNPQGTALECSRFLGGGGEDTGRGIALDSSGGIHVTGDTKSASFPALGGPGLTFAGLRDAFVSKLSCPASCLPAPANLTGWWNMAPAGVDGPPLLVNLVGVGGLDDRASISGATTTPLGKYGAALQFDGVNDFVSAPATQSLNVGTGDFSIDLWVKIATPADNPGAAMLVEKRLPASGIGYSLFLANNRPALRLADPAGFTDFGAVNPFPTDNKWHLLAVTVDRDSAQGLVFYVDGAPQGAAFDPTGRQGNLDSVSALHIGGSTAGSDYFEGAIDEVEVFKRALTAAEVQQLVAAPKCAPGGLAPCAQPDLSVLSVLAPSPVLLGSNTLSVSVLVLNVGTQPSGPVTVGVSISPNPNCTGPQINLGSLASASLTTGGSALLQGTFDALRPIGTYYVCATVDPLDAIAECSEANNKRATPPLVLTQVCPSPDFVVTGLTVPAAAKAGQTMNVGLSVANLGANYAAPPAATVGIYVSADNNITTSDPQIATLPLGSMGAGISTFWSNLPIGLPASLATGAYYLGGLMDWDAKVTECEETNNGRAANTTVQIAGQAVVSGGGGPLNPSAAAVVRLPAVEEPTLFSGPNALLYRKERGSRDLITMSVDPPGADVALYVRRLSPPEISNQAIAKGGTAGFLTKDTGEILQPLVGQSLPPDFGPDQPPALDDLIEADYRATGGSTTVAIPGAAGAGEYYIALALNTPGVPVTVTLTVAEREIVQLFSQIADGEGWKTSIILVNVGTQPAPFTLRFWAGDGTPLRLPFEGSPGRLEVLQNTIPVGGSRTIETLGTDPTLAQGWAQLETPATIGGLAVFRQRVAGRPDQEAAVPLGTTAPRFLLPFDNIDNFVTSMALVNTGPTAGGIPAAPRLEAGGSLNGDTINLPSRGQTAFTLPQRLPSSANRRGVVEFTSGAGAFAALGLRFHPAGAFTSFPALAPSSSRPSSQILSQIADGSNWQTTIILVNLDTQAAPFTLRFWKSDGTALPLPFVGLLEPADTVQGTIPAGGAQTIRTLGRAAQLSQGWAELATSRLIGGLAVFGQSVAGRPTQEAAVTITSSGSRFRLPFDNTQDFVTSMALVNTHASQSVVVSVVVRDEAGTQVLTESVPVGPRSHTAFALPDRFPRLVGRKGVAEFSVTGGEITGLGLRFNPGGAFTSFAVQ